MNVIYEPKGRAGEYAPLACNLYLGCTHGCTYCYAPACMHKTSAVWHSEGVARYSVIEFFERDAKRLQGDPRKILFSFLSDPYQPIEAEKKLTRHALELVKKYNLKSQILTKGGELVKRDFDLFRECGTELGVTLCFVNDDLRRQWEPHTASVPERISLLKAAYKAGIYTWISLEPVIDPAEALMVIKKMCSYVRFWKIGKLNHNKDVENTVDWRKFRVDAENLLKEKGAAYYIKEYLRAFA